MVYIPGSISGNDKVKIGKQIPVSPGIGEDLGNDLLNAIYRQASERYESGEWTMKDFKEFRNEIASCSIDVFFEYAEVILYLMSLPSYQSKLFVLGLDLDYEIHALEERRKVQVIDSDNNKIVKEYYEVVRRDYRVGDIVSVAKTLHSRLNSIQARFLEQRHPEYKATDSPKLRRDILMSILNEKLIDGGEDIEYLYEEFDKNFKRLEDLPIKDYIVRQRERLVPATRHMIARCISYNEIKIERNFDHYVREQSSAAFFKSLKKKGHKFGQWSSD